MGGALIYKWIAAYTEGPTWFVMCNDGWNIDHRRWSKRCHLTRGDQTFKRKKNALILFKLLLPRLLWIFTIYVHFVIRCTFHLYMGKTNLGLHVQISFKGRCSFSPLPSPLFQSQVGHSLIRQVASPLSPKMNCIHRDVTSVSFCTGLSNKKAESYYYSWLHWLLGYLILLKDRHDELIYESINHFAQSWINLKVKGNQDSKKVERFSPPPGFKLSSPLNVYQKCKSSYFEGLVYLKWHLVWVRKKSISSLKVTVIEAGVNAGNRWDLDSD